MNPARAAVEFANTLLTTEDAEIGTTPRDVVWTHRKVTLYRYRSDRREHAVPVLLVFALINRPTIFDLRQGNSFVEYLLDQGFDVFLLDWGEPDDEDADMGLEAYVVRRAAVGHPRDAARGRRRRGLAAGLVHRRHAVRDALRAGARHRRAQPRAADHADRHHGLALHGLGRARQLRRRPGGRRLPRHPRADDRLRQQAAQAEDELLDTYAKLWEGALEGKARPEAYQPMAKWVADNPPFPSRAFREWNTWMYKENRLVRGRMRLRGRARGPGATSSRTCSSSPPAPTTSRRRPGTAPIFDLVSSEDVTHFDRPGGHIGLMAGSRAREDIWPDIAGWLAERSDQ